MPDAKGRRHVGTTQFLVGATVDSQRNQPLYPIEVLVTVVPLTFPCEILVQ